METLSLFTYICYAIQLIGIIVFMIAEIVPAKRHIGRILLILVGNVGSIVLFFFVPTIHYTVPLFLAGIVVVVLVIINTRGHWND